MDEQNTVQRELTEEEKKNPVSSGAVEWHDPLDKPAHSQEQPTGKLALASLMFGIAGICMICAPPAAAILGAVGLTCGILSRAKHESAKGLGIAGILVSAGAICAVLMVGVMHLVIQLGGTGVNSHYQDVENGLGI